MTMHSSDAELDEHLPRMAPKGGEKSIIPGTCDYVTIYGKDILKMWLC